MTSEEVGMVATLYGRGLADGKVVAEALQVCRDALMQLECECGGGGWLLMIGSRRLPDLLHDDRNQLLFRIECCDLCKRFKTDKEAAEYAAKAGVRLDRKGRVTG